MRIDQDGVVEPVERRRVVTSALGRDPETVAAGEVDDRADEAIAKPLAAPSRSRLRT